MNILREPNLSRPSHLFQCRPAIHSITPNTNRRPPLIPVDLHHAIKQLLRRARTLLNPRLLVRDPKELRTLHNRRLVIRQMLHNNLPQKVRPRTEIRIKNRKEIPLRPRKRPPQIPRLAQPRPVLPHHVPKSIPFRQCPYRRLVPIIQYPHFELRCGPVQPHDVLVGILQDLDRLRAARQVHVHGRRRILRDGELLHNLAVRGIVPVPPDHSDKVGDDQVDVEKPDEDAVPRKDGRADCKQPHPCREGQEGEDAEDIEGNAVGVQVAKLFVVGWACGEDEVWFRGGTVGAAEGGVGAAEGVAGLFLLLRGRRGVLFRVVGGGGSLRDWCC